MAPKEGDIVGLYKVGWVSSHDAICKVVVDDSNHSDQYDVGHGIVATERRVNFDSE